MSDTVPWGQNIQGSQQGGGQITFFDPTKFQKTQDFPNLAASQQSHNQPSHNQAESNPTPQSQSGHSTNQDSTANAWTSWNWTDGSNPYLNSQNTETAGTYNGTEYNYQNQWNNQQWNHEQTQQNNQYHWDPNSQQWQPNYYDPSQQAVDPNQYGYNQYWNSGVSQSNSTGTENYQAINSTAEPDSGQNNGVENVQNTGFAQQESIQNIDHSSVHGTNQPNNNLNHTDESSLQENEYLNQSNSSSCQNESGYLNQSATEESLDQSEGSVGRFYVNDYVPEGDEQLPLRQSSVQGVSSSEQQGSQTFETALIENKENAESSDSIPSQAVGTEPGGVPNVADFASHSVPFSDQMSHNFVNQQYNAQPDQSYQYAVDGSQGQPEPLAKETDREEEINQPAKSETHSEDGWELVQPHGLGPPSHSRNQSMDNNVQFFISSGNSSLRVSPSGSSKSKDEVESIPGHNEGHMDGARTESEKLTETLEQSSLLNKSQNTPGVSNSNEVLDSVPPPHSSLPLSGPPPISSLGPPPMGGAGRVNPFRKSPLTLSAPTSKVDNPSPITNDSLLSSTRLDTTKGNFANSPVSLNQSISPIPPEVQSMTVNNVDNESPNIQESTEPGHTPDTPLSSLNQRKGTNVPQSPIMPRKESPFQPPVPVPRNIPDSRNKPVKASHDIPGVPSNVHQNSNMNDRNDPEYQNEKTGRKTPDWENSHRGKNYGRTTPDLDKSVEKLTAENKSGRKTPDWDSRKGYERRTGRRTPDWDRERTADRTRGRRTPDWDSRQAYEKDRYGRRTPDWDSRRSAERNQGRRTPDWDSRQASRYGRKTPDWDQTSNNDNSRRSYDRAEDSIRDRREFDEDKLSGKPPAGTSGVSSKGQSRPQARQSAFREMVKNRNKNNVSPATSLLDFEPPAISNILLVPAAADAKTSKKEQSKDTSEDLSDLKPVASLISSLSEQISTDDSVSKIKGQNRSDEKTEKIKSDGSREPNVRTGYEKEPNVRTGYDKNSDRSTRDTLRHNRSYERGLNDTRNASREKLRSYGSRDSLDSELRNDSRERHKRGNSRDRDRLDPYDRYYRDRDRERPPSRNAEEYKRNGYRDREYVRPNERYDRPRSRHDENRPPSRQTDMDRSRSRADYERDYYKQRGYDYDDYYRRSQYYDRSYYDYYYYNQGYYDEMGYYHDPNASRYAYDQYQRRQQGGTPGSMSDAGDESKTDDKKKSADSESKQKKRFEYPPDLQQYAGYYDDQYGYYGDYHGQRWDPHVQAWVQQSAVDQEPRRATPEKFTIPHMRASFGPSGQMVKILPNRPADGQPATIEIHEVEAMLAENVESQELREFPGPLIRGDTHKNDVLLFCQRKAKECYNNVDLDDRESAELIWRFLELLIKQNGSIVGTDLADLLLEGHEPTTLDYRRTGMRIAQSLDNLEGEEEVDQSVVSDRSVVNKTKTVEEVTDRFRHLLLYGRKKDALDWGMKNNLWGHALFLASKMDSRAHANVMTRFANVAMRMNDPLQTLYQQMSGRQPAAVTCVAEERWGDWRPHLAMILSNHTSRPDLDRKSIMQLGDTLASKGFLHASHFCYLMSQTGFGSYSKKTSKIVLIGSSHSNLPLEEFGNNEAIQCTEIYEYALALGNAAVCLHNFQLFKYLYATRLSDWGFPQEALQYCEVIAKNINMNPAFFQHTLVKLVYDLASQLKFSDPQRLEETEDMVDPDWLRGLHTTLVQFEEGAIQTMSGSATPMYFSGTRASSESGEVGMYMQGGDFGSQGSFPQENGYGAQGNMYSIQEQSSYHQGYNQGQGDFQGHMTGDFQGHASQEQSHSHQEVTAEGQQQTHDTTDGTQGHQMGSNQWQQYGGGEGHQQQTGNETQANWQQGYTGYDQHQWSSMHQQQTANQNVATDAANQGTDPSQGFQNQYQNQSTDSQMTSSWGSGQHKQSGFPPNTNLSNSMGSTSSAKRESVASTSSFSRGDSQVAEEDDDDDDEGEDQDGMGNAHQPGIFDLVQPAAQQRIIPPRLRKRTISGDSVGSTGTTTSSKVQQQKKDEKKPSLDKSKPQSKGGEGIWGKIGGLFRGKGKNEMILPDDKEPSIVWDEDKKQWINKDGTEEDNTVAAPPPKDHELTGRPGPAAGPGTEKRASLPMAPPSADMAGNMFQRRKGPLGARGQYVDVLNPKPASTPQVPSNLFNTIPHAQSAPAIFVPGGSADDSGKKPSPVPEPIQEEKISAPPSMNTLSVHQDDNLSRSSSMSSVSQEVQQILAKKEASEAAGPGAAPVLFNPSQFQGNQSAKQPQGGAGHRLSSRRVYPK